MAKIEFRISNLKSQIPQSKIDNVPLILRRQSEIGNR